MPAEIELLPVVRYRCCTCNGTGVTGDGETCPDCDGVGIDNYGA